VRSLVELKLQVEELRRRADDDRSERAGWLGEVRPGGAIVPLTSGIEPRDAPPPPNTVVITPGMTMAEIERSVIESALRSTRGNRRKAADMLAIGERTLYRKLKEYQISPDSVSVEE
jgi:DNA-binding NtrC family response regulator